MIGHAPYRSKIDVKFYVLKVPSAYNVIFDGTTLTALQTITSIPHLNMKFSTEFGIRVVVGVKKYPGNLNVDELKQVRAEHESKGK